MSNSDVVQVNADALALALRIRAAGSFETTHEVDGRKVSVTRGPGGQFASPGGGDGGSVAAPKSRLQEFGSNLVKTLKLQEAADKIAKLPKESQAGFRRLLGDNPLTKDISSKLDGSTKAGFEAGNTLINSLKGVEWTKLPKQFADGVGALVKDVKENPTDFLLGVGAVGALTFGVASALAAGSLAAALPGAIGTAMETGDMATLGIHLFKLLGKSLWAIIATVIVVPLIGQVVVAKAFGAEPKELTAEQKQAEEEKAKKKAEIMKRATQFAARQAAREREDPTVRKMRYMGIDTDLLQKVQLDLKTKADAAADKTARAAATATIEQLEEEIAASEKAWESYMDSVGTDISNETQVKLEQEMRQHVKHVKKLIDQK